MAMSLTQIQSELGRLGQLQAALIGLREKMTPDEKIKALEDAQPHVLPKTVQAEALLQVGYGLTVADCKAIIKERDADPVRWPLEEYRKAQAMLAAYNTETPKPSSTRLGWHRTGGA